MGSRNGPWNPKGLATKVGDEGASKEAGTNGTTQNLRIVSYVRRDNEEKIQQYNRYVERREERNLRTQALGRYVFGILRG